MTPSAPWYLLAGLILGAAWPPILYLAVPAVVVWGVWTLAPVVSGELTGQRVPEFDDVDELARRRR